MALRKKLRKLVAFREWEDPNVILEEIHAAACDIEAGGFYVTHRNVVYRITDAGAWVPSILYG